MGERVIRLLIVYDVEGWAYHRRASALMHHAPEDFRVQMLPLRLIESAQDCDLVFNLDSSYLRPVVPGVPHVLSWNSDANRRAERWDRVMAAADFVVCNNKAVFLAHNRPPGTCCIANGVETSDWRVTAPIADRPESIFWSGSSNPLKGKGWEILGSDAVREGLRSHGFEADFHPVASTRDPLLQTGAMRKHYNSSGYVLCLSESEGTPNTSLEGMACGCCLVTTRVGNVLEFGRDGENCVLIDRTSAGLLDGLMRARENRIAIATAGAELMRDEWSYGPLGDRSAYYFRLFRRILESGAESVGQFSYDEVHWSEI